MIRALLPILCLSLSACAGFVKRDGTQTTAAVSVGSSTVFQDGDLHFGTQGRDADYFRLVKKGKDYALTEAKPQPSRLISEPVKIKGLLGLSETAVNEASDLASDVVDSQ